MNLTAPDRGPEPGDTTETKALNFTVSPTTDGLSEELSTVEVLAVVTDWLRLADETVKLSGSNGA